MSRHRKTRRLKDKLSVRTGSKKDFIQRGQEGKIASRNTLLKHRKRQKSAFEKHLEDRQLKKNRNTPTQKAHGKGKSEEADR